MIRIDVSRLNYLVEDGPDLELVWTPFCPTRQSSLPLYTSEGVPTNVLLVAWVQFYLTDSRALNVGHVRNPGQMLV